MKKNHLLASLFTLIALNVHAAVKPSEAARLGADLTPLGAETAGNADGTIPAWNGGILTPPAGYKVGDHHPDPFAADKPLYTVTPSNLGQYESKLTAGSVSLLKAYADKVATAYSKEEKAEIERFTTAEVKLLASAKFTGGIYALAFSPDGRHLAAAGEDGHVRLITTSDGSVAKDFIPVPLADAKVTVSTPRPRE
jgi:WD40 repeat protein